MRRDLSDWCDLDLAHLLIFGDHPDLADGQDDPSVKTALSPSSGW